MSTLNVANVTDCTTSVPTGYVVNGPTKSWVYWNGTGTLAIRDSFNTSSVTDLGTGNYRADVTSGFQAAPGHLGFGSGVVFCTSAGTNTTSNYYVAQWNSSGTLTDGSRMNGAAFGDLA